MINALFKPSIKLLSSFTFLKKMVIIGLVFTAPTAYLLYQLNNISNTNIDFARAEVTGTAQLAIALNALDSAQQHRWHHQRMLTNEASDATPLFKASQTELDQELGALEKANPALTAIASNTIQDIVRSVGDVTSLMNRVDKSSSGQNSSLKQASQMMSQMDAATQHNAALVQQDTTNTSSLKSASDQLLQLVATFNVLNIFIFSI